MTHLGNHLLNLSLSTREGRNTDTVEVQAKYATEGVYVRLWAGLGDQVARLDLTVDEALVLADALNEAVAATRKSAEDDPRFGHWR